MKWSPTDGFVKAKSAVGAVARGVEAKLDAKVMAWQQPSNQSAYGTYGNNPQTGQPAPAQTGTGVPPASAGSGRNKPLPKRPVAQNGSGKPSSDDEIQQFRQWQGSQSQWSGLGTGRVWRDYESLSGMTMNHDRSQYKFHDVAPRTGWGSGRAKEVGADRGEDTNTETVDMTPPEQKTDDDWSASENTFKPDDLPVGTYKPPVNKLPGDDGDDW